MASIVWLALGAVDENHVTIDRRLDGSKLLDLILPPNEAIDAIASLDDQHERWVRWYGEEDVYKMRRKAAVRIVLSHYAAKCRDFLIEVFRLRAS